MPLKNYGVLKGKALAAKREDGQDTPHYQVQIKAGGTNFRIAVNVKSQEAPSELLFLVDQDFRHPITSRLPALRDGFTGAGAAAGRSRSRLHPGKSVRSARDEGAPQLSSRPRQRPERPSGPLCQAGIGDPAAIVYAFGQRWGPENGQTDKIFGFRPGDGIHDIHMNQGNSDSFRNDDGVWQDGGVIVHYPGTDQWVGVFLAFQSQAWHTDDQTGHTTPDVPTPGPGPTPDPSEPDHVVRIVAALVNPKGPDGGLETVCLLNASPDPVDLSGWQLADRMKNKCPISGTLAPGTTTTINLPPTVQLGNKGGLITLLNSRGLKVDGVSYTAADAKAEGWMVVF